MQAPQLVDGNRTHAMNPSRRDRVRPSRLRRLWEDERGQDLIEYALLTGIIALAGALVFPPLKDRMASVYESWNSNAQDLSTPPPPGS